MKKLLLLAIALVVVRLALMVATPVFDPSEARYAAISANMARTGEFVVPHFTYRGVYQSFDGKPPLVFQAGGVACKVLGTESPYTLQFGVRLFPFLSAALLLLILYRVVKHFSDAETGRLAVWICATCTAFYAAAGLSMTDMSLTCCVAGALLLYRLFADTKGWGAASGVAILLGAGMIVKGPVALVMFGLPVLVDAAVNKRWKVIFTARWLAVAPLFLLVAVPWFILVEQKNPGSVWYFFYNENLMRFLVHDYGDKYGAGREKFRGVAILWALVATLPWVLVPAWKLIQQKGRGIQWKSFGLLSLLAITGFWCLTSRVLLYYLFPMIPLFAAHEALVGDRALLKKLIPTGAILSIVVTLGALVGGMFFSDKMQGPKSAFYPRSGNRFSYEFYHGTPASALEAATK